MTSRVDASTLVAAVALGSLLIGTPAAAQVTATATEARTEAEAQPISPGAAAADPLTPPKEEAGPIAAPGTPAAAVRPDVPADAIVLEVRKLAAARATTGAGGSGAGGAGGRADREAVDAFYATGTGEAVWTTPKGFSDKGRAVHAELWKATDFGLDPTALDIPGVPADGASLDVLAQIELKLSLAVLRYARHARGGRVDPQSISKLIDYQPRPYAPGSVIAAIAASDDVDVYLRGLNPQHQGFKRLQQALVAHRAGKGEVAGKRGASDVEMRILVNMERWRWMPDDMGAFHVLDNVPEQVTRVIHDGKAIFTEKIVVGKTNTPTPEFTAPMRFVIFHPSWGVPDGIKANELAPALRRASASGGGGWLFGGETTGPARVLARHELKVFQNGREINPNTVNWNAVDARQFSFQQPPSAKNVLGVVKFRFPNRHDVYMHDTQEKHYFGHSVRAYSHGCMRVQNPVKLAQVLLAHDKGWSADKVQSFVTRGATADITLEKPVPVHVAYFTARVDDDGKLNLYGDLYAKDARIASALAGKNVSLAPIAAAAPEKETAGAAGAPGEPGKRAEKDKKGRQRVQTAATKSTGGGVGFNPFPGLTGN